jgi:hypothetical protein
MERSSQRVAAAFTDAGGMRSRVGSTKSRSSRHCGSSGSSEHADRPTHDALGLLARRWTVSWPRQFTRKPRTADHAPGLPAESNARARQKRSAFGSDVVENCEAVKAAWFTTVVEKVFDLLT